jgi:hypothetical protein
MRMGIALITHPAHNAALETEVDSTIECIKVAFSGNEGEDTTTSGQDVRWYDVATEKARIVGGKSCSCPLLDG